MRNSFLEETWLQDAKAGDDSLSSPLAMDLLDQEGLTFEDLPAIEKEGGSIRKTIALHTRAMLRYAQENCQDCDVQRWARDLWTRAQDKAGENAVHSAVAFEAANDPAIHEIEAEVRRRLATEGSAAVQKRTKDQPTIAGLHRMLADNLEQQNIAASH